ncbi:MAG TPA: 3'-5' exonuclease [Leptospiraceae bacterium]|nr:3'-5' exonuclease [Leptospiraceae bacterium]HNM03772.1 3'-5' exonuclease [Leptospiraceae bacterium]
MTDRILDSLNEPQKEAVLHTEGPLLILAGAGSGKTRVITHRIAHLIMNRNVYPFKICAVTFTNKAAAEMRERIIGLLPNSGHMVTMKTFHSLCLGILRKNPDRVGRKSGFTVLDTGLQESLIKTILKDKELDSKEYRPAYFSNAIQRAKDDLISEEEFLSEFPRPDRHTKALHEVYREYEKRKVQNNAFDFGDLIFYSVKLLQSDTEILEYYRDHWHYLLVDEFQDTNHAQYVLTKLLAGERKNVCVVGDDDQSIYSWRGANIENILGFEKDFPGTKIIKLEENYRSTGNIIEAAKKIIENNTERKNKSIFTSNADGEKILITECSSEAEEAAFIINAIQKYQKVEGSYRGMAVFYRTNAQSRFFEEALRNKSIPYVIHGGFRFFDRMEIKDMIAYLCVLVNPDDSMSLMRIINYPPRGIGETSIEKIRKKSLDENRPILDILKKGDLDMRKASLKSVQEFTANIEELQTQLRTGIMPSIVSANLLKLMKISEHLSGMKDFESADRLENINQFILSIQEYEENTENPSLEEYLNQISLLTSEEAEKDLEDFVTLMTIHNSKGLEFDTVFLAGMEEGTFPHSMSIQDDNIEEERRLCYVAVTRARKKLFLSYCQSTRKFGDFQFRIPSRFLDELPKDLIYRNRGNSVRASEIRTPFASNRKSNPKEEAKPKSTVTAQGRTGEKYTVGAKVSHKDYGTGKIISITGTGDNQKIKVQFGFSEKSFLAAYTNLEVL